MSNVPQQVAELKSLMKEFKGKGFEFLGPKPKEATSANPTRLKIAFSTPVPLTVVVAMPADYPTSASPVFKVEGESLEEAVVEAIEELLAEQASYMPGMECISFALQALADLELSALDLGKPGRCRSIFKMDVVNNSPHFSKSLTQCTTGLPCIWFYRTIECTKNAKFSFAVTPYRAVYCIVDAPHKKAAVEFMKDIRTDGSFDLDMLGKPCKLQMSVVEEFEMKAKAKGVPEGFSSVEYRTTEDFDKLMDPYNMKTAGVV